MGIWPCSVSCLDPSVTGRTEDVVVAVQEEAVEAEDAAWVAAMALIPEESVNLIGTAAVTDRKYYFICYKVFSCKSL